jgi:hypothetical protein
MPGTRIYPSTRADEWVSLLKRFRPCVPSVCCMTTQIIRMVGEDQAGPDEIRDVVVAGQRMRHRRQDLAELLRSVMSWTRRAVQHMPDADLHVMPGGHAPWLHRAGQVALTHEFLDTH